jgi:tRNA G10  N-methylase Trm11
MQSLLILGRQPDIGMAELQSLYGPEKVDRINNQAAVVDIDPCNFYFDRIGGSTKFCKLLTIIETSNWHDVEKFLIKVSPDQSRGMPDGKMTLGLSQYGFSLGYKELLASGIKLKKAIQSTGRSVRIVPNKSNELTSAQVIHNNLTSSKAWDLVIVLSENKTYIAQTAKVQDIESYAKRDQARPFRDSRVGMLPPKLAQIIINLAHGKLSESELTNTCEDNQEPIIDRGLSKIKVLDPFCGSGVILQEACLMGYGVIGSDINERMVDYSIKNLEWLKTKFNVRKDHPIEIFATDAVNASWPIINFIASETNLGKPLSTVPSQYELQQIVSESNDIIELFLKNVAKQTRSGFRLCIAIPAWQISRNKFKQLPLIDLIDKMGYNFVDFKNISNEQLIYYRPGQIVARQLLVLTRKST